MIQYTKVSASGYSTSALTGLMSRRSRWPCAIMNSTSVPIRISSNSRRRGAMLEVPSSAARLAATAWITPTSASTAHR